MTEVHWLAADGAKAALFQWAHHGHPGIGPAPPRPSDRKFRLIACAGVRLLSGRMNEPVVQEVVELTERFADARTNADRRLIKHARQRAKQDYVADRLRGNQPHNIHAAYFILDSLLMVSAAAAACETKDRIDNIHPNLSYSQIIRDIVGNPFRHVTFAPVWRAETAVSLATGIYAERAFDRMPILADALEEAGCNNADVLSHCRGPGPHARGCWVVDGVLGKS